MNLELPFDELSSSELDDFLSRIDRELEALFVEDVEKIFEQLRGDGILPQQPEIG